jgi:hypothetical protein
MAIAPRGRCRSGALARRGRLAPSSALGRASSARGGLRSGAAPLSPASGPLRAAARPTTSRSPDVQLQTDAATAPPPTSARRAHRQHLHTPSQTRRRASAEIERLKQRPQARCATMRRARSSIDSAAFRAARARRRRPSQRCRAPSRRLCRARHRHAAARRAHAWRSARRSKRAERERSTLGYGCPRAPSDRLARRVQPAELAADNRVQHVGRARVKASEGQMRHRARERGLNREPGTLFLKWPDGANFASCLAETTVPAGKRS